MSKMNPVVHFEMPYDDKKRMSDFYGKVFGWQAQMLGPEMGEYVVVSTTENDPVTHFPKEPGRINGGFFKKTEKHKVPTMVIAVEDIKESMKKIEEAGGSIIGGDHMDKEPDDIPGVGLYVAFTDTEGNRIALLQPKPMMETGAK
jgi:predicted enzyme related to lactoylglutathione lyase